MIDLHSHILPGIDDGPKDIAGSLELAAALADDGVEIVAATPHVRYDHPGVVVAEIAERTKALAKAVAARGIPLRVIPAAEVDLRWALDAADDEVRLASIGQAGRYVLVETPYGPLGGNFEQLLFNAFAPRGLSVVLAHPERNESFQADPERLRALAGRGVVLQLTAPALVRRRSRSRSQKLALWLLEEGLAGLLSSDAHTRSSRRGPNLAAAVRGAAHVNPALARWLVTDAPAAVLAGDPLPEAPVRRKAKRKLLFR